MKWSSKAPNSELLDVKGSVTSGVSMKIQVMNRERCNANYLYPLLPLARCRPPSPCTWQYSLDTHQPLEERIPALCSLKWGEEKKGGSAREMQQYFSLEWEIPEICMGTSKSRIEP